MYPNSHSLSKFLYSFIKKQPIAFIVFFLSPTILILESTVMPYALKMIIDCISTHQGPRNNIFLQLKPALYLYTGCWLIWTIVARSQNLWQAYILPKFEADIRMSSLSYVLEHSYRYFSNQFSGNIANKISDLPKSLDTIRMILCWNVVSSISTVSAALIVMFFINICFSY